MGGNVNKEKSLVDIYIMYYTTGKFAKLLHLTPKTIQRWDKLDILKPIKMSDTGRRMYSHQQYLDYFNMQNKEIKTTYSYCRVSSSNQKDDLSRQIDYVKQFAYNKGIVCTVLSDIGSGLNYKRKNLLELLTLITANKVDELIIAHKDRLVRFGFELFEWLCVKYDVKLTVIDNKQSSPAEEISKDLISIIHVFSSRFYGIRKYASKIKKEIDNSVTS